MQLLIAYISSIILFVALDLLWLGVIAKDYYRNQIGELLLEQFNWTAAIIFYLIFLTGLLIFVIHPALLKSSWTQALLFGALFGFFAYATYDLTNLATLKNWPVVLSFVDMAWGAVIGGVVSTGAYFIATFFIK